MLKATGLHQAFGRGPARVEVLRGLSIELVPGELTLVAGPSGCGKSTLLAILSGLLHPVAGHVLTLGRNLAALSPGERDRFRLEHTAFVFQRFNLFPALTSLEQVCVPLAYMGLDREAATRRAEEALLAVGLRDRLRSRPAELSGGEQQRVALARAIAKSPALLFADEPTSALDASNGVAVINLLRAAAHDRGALVLCVSHDSRLMARADRIVEMEDGVIRSDSRNRTLEPDALRMRSL